MRNNMNKHFHDWMPDWVKSAIKQKKCSQCSENFTKNGIVAIGIRELENASHSLYVEHKCLNCDFRAISSLGKQKESLEGLCYMIIESIKKHKLARKSKMFQNKDDSKPMSEKEVKGFINFIQKSSSHDDFLREIGVVLPPDNHDTS